MDPDNSLSAESGETLVQEQGEHCMVLVRFEGYPDIALEHFPSRWGEESRQLVDLLVVIDDRCLPFRSCVLFESTNLLPE